MLLPFEANNKKNFSVTLKICMEMKRISIQDKENLVLEDNLFS